MSCEHLVCAVCTGPVAEGRCPTCRLAREHVHSAFTITPQLIAALLVLLAALTVLGASLR